MEGTETPLFFYQLHNQHIQPSYGARFEAVDASNITIFGTKNEAATNGSIEPTNSLPVPLLFTNCDNIRIYGYSGLSTTRRGWGLLNFVGSRNFLVANSGAWRASEQIAYPYVQERDASGSIIGNRRAPS